MKLPIRVVENKMERFAGPGGLIIERLKESQASAFLAMVGGNDKEEQHGEN